MLPPEDVKLGFFTIAALDAQGDSSARLGRLSIKGRNVIPTPNFLAITSRGVLPHITPDVISEHSEFGGVHMALEDYIEKATNGTPPIMNCPSRKSSPLHTFTALPSTIITLLAPRRNPAVSAPNGNTDSAISVFTSVGFQSLSNSSYTRYVKKLSPDIVISLADIPYGTLPGTKRVAKMGDRTSQWLESLISDLETSESFPASSPAIFAPILPIDYHSQSEYLHHLADDLAESISGLAFYSSSLLPDIPATTALSLIPRLSLDEPSSPHHILRQVSLGMDLFTIPFVGFATDSGLALNFQFPRTSSNGEAIPAKADGLARIKPLAIDLSSNSYATSITPLMKTCECYACTSHHCAYVHHLLSAKEMLGWVLLQIHNHQVLSSFFSDVRESIKSGRFEEDKDVFEREYESELPEGSGQKPRVRGYHFRSEGPDEKKRNKPAWGELSDGKMDVDDAADPEAEENSIELEDKRFAEAVGWQ